MGRRRRGLVVALVLGVGAAALGPPGRADTAGAPPACRPGGPVVTMHGTVPGGAQPHYLELPFDVAAGTTRVEVGYRYGDAGDPVALPSTPLTQTVVDLGLWDADGVGTPAGFRGWSGSRQGRLHAGQRPVWVDASSAERGYRPGRVEPGVWHVDLGIAAVGPTGGAWSVEVRCLGAPAGTGAPPFRPAFVDPAHVARAEPGWYHGDFHMHGRHSHPSAPPWDAFVGFARAAALDFLPVTDYVTDQHHRELGPVQAANPDLVIWPGREIITYHGHANAIGETPSVIEWRHGHGDVSLRDIQSATVADGALFQVNHPTIFPGPLFRNFCRGCEFTLGDVIDWAKVDTIEVLTGPILVDDGDIGGPGTGVMIQNPFVEPAIDLWESKLRAGYRITAVSGSDDKLGPGLGSSATAVYASQLSRRALIDAVRAGHAFVRTRGVHGSPFVEVTATAPDGQRAIVGDTLHADAATVRVHVRGGDGQLLRISRDGDVVGLVPVAGDDFVHTFVASRSRSSGPLGTFWRVDTLDLRSLTTIGNPIFLAPPG